MTITPAEARTKSADHVELVALLRDARLFRSLEPDVISALANACEVVDVLAGTMLVRSGAHVDALYGVLHGGLRLVHRVDGGLDRTVGELYRGRMLGVNMMLVDRPSTVDVLVLRDSRLLCLSRNRFLALAQKHPSLLQAFASAMSEQALDLLGAVTGAPISEPHPGNFAVIPISADDAVARTLRRLVDAMHARYGATHVTAERVDRALGAGAANAGGSRVTEWLSNVEFGARAVVYECDRTQSPWTIRCVRQSDRLVLVAAPGDVRRLRELAEALERAQAAGITRDIEVVLVHPQGTTLPLATRAWFLLPGLHRVHHVRTDDKGDLDRVVRHLVGRAIGLAFSGGGARGTAHLGVLAAILEAGIPIDFICGTSMGSIFAAGLAQGWSIQRMRDTVADVFGPLFALYDFTVPISALLEGKKLDRVMRQLYEDNEIEDLWLPFFCVSTDLARGELVVHERGPVWKSVRASCTIPGIFPPMQMAGRALVDGGLMDNLPIDLLAERCPGSLIAVDVFPYGDPTFTRPAGEIAPRLRTLRTKLKGEPASPPLFDILVRSTLLGSKFRQETVAARLKNVLRLEPPVAAFGLLRWRAHRELFEAGYRYTQSVLAREARRFLEQALA